MTRLFAAEVLKLRTIRTPWGLALVAVGFGGLLAAAHIGSPPNGRRLAPGYQFDLVLSAAFPAVLLALLLGMLLFTNEFRHGTISRTLLVTPRRPILVALKLMVGAAAGIGLALLAVATASVVAVIWLGIVDVPLQFGDAADAFWRSLLAAALVGALAEPIVWVLLGLVHIGGVADYLPAVTVLSILDTQGENLPFAGTAGMAVIWIAVASALAVLRTSRRDIT
jgi:hypothetical protein